jgi:hypothetical protein
MDVSNALSHAARNGKVLGYRADRLDKAKQKLLLWLQKSNVSMGIR